ncbi:MULTISPECIES: hypothetical protein [Bacillus subtilis group]|uniref:hypothetical protein n=1 Tax=Bacillus halotolerans TaxID=260554 RepID=UPI002DC03FE5|nr:hypothetical protein [Bacillus halotolerans]MEC1649350.1 hypothetical protein [Bacillus halotolerans]
MYLISQVWSEAKFHMVISESESLHQKALCKLEAQGGKVLRNERIDNTLGSVIVNGKRSVWPLTKSEGADPDV